MSSAQHAETMNVESTVAVDQLNSHANMSTLSPEIKAGMCETIVEIKSWLELRDKMQAKVAATAMAYTSQDTSTAADGNESHASFYTSTDSNASAFGGGRTACEACFALSHTSGTPYQLGDDICSCGDLFFRATHEQSNVFSPSHPQCIDPPRAEALHGAGIDVSSLLNYDKCCACALTDPNTMIDDICSCGDQFLRAHHQMDTRPLSWSPVLSKKAFAMESRGSSKSKRQGSLRTIFSEEPPRVEVASNEDEDDVLQFLNYQLF